MPAAAVIPAPIAYIKVVAVKKLVLRMNRAKKAQSNLANHVPLCSLLYVKLEAL